MMSGDNSLTLADQREAVMSHPQYCVRDKQAVEEDSVLPLLETR